MVNSGKYHLSSSYPKLLAAFGAWATLGIAIILLGTGQYLFGGVLAVAAVGMIVLVIRADRISERPFSRIDLAVQWVVLAVPMVLAVLLFILAYAFFRPFAPYMALYLAVLMVLAALVARELLRRVPSEDIY